MADTLLQLQGGFKSYGTKVLFQDASFSVNEGDHVGVIGPNGAGKTTLFKVLLGEEHLEKGSIIKARKLEVGYLSQHDIWQEGETGVSFLERNTRIPIWDVYSQLDQFQITEEILARPLASLSGGYRMRIKLLSLLSQEPNLMLLDEPTNYLDLETTLILEKFLQKYQGTFLLISHDREFLRRTTDHTLEVEQGEITKYNGNIDDYFDQKQLMREQLESQAQSQQEKRAKILDFVARFGAKATKAKQAQSRLRTLEKMENIEIKPLPMSARIRIPAPAKTGKKIFSLEEVKLGYAQKEILRDVNLHVSRGEHISVVGFNGAGKSTLLKALAGKLEPLEGKIQWGDGVELAYFAQHVVEALDGSDTVLEAFSRDAHPGVMPQQILDLAGSLLFSGDDVKKKVSVLSGGEKSRVALGKVLLKRAPCLVLDEPTNHLDFQTVEALTEALKAYEGTVLVVSHDRGFVSRVAGKIWEVANGKVNVYLGTYDEYVWSVQKFVSAPTAKKETKAANSSKNEKFNWKEERKKLDRDLRITLKRISDLEALIESDQKALQILNEEVALNLDWKKIKELSELGNKIAATESEWLQKSSEKEEIEKKLAELVGE